MRFGEYLAQTLAKAGLSQQAFAIKVGYHQPNLNQVIRGKRAPPLRRLGTWTKVLGSAVDVDRFEVLAQLEHSPPSIRAYVERLEEENAKLRTG